MARRWCVCLVVLCAGAAGSEGFEFPQSFEGLWQGSPDFTMLGRTSSVLTMALARAPNLDYLLEDNIYFDTDAAIGWQRFYVESTGSTAGALWYCGVARNISNAQEDAGSGYPELFRATTTPSPADKVVTFCTDSDNENMMKFAPFPNQCTGCGCANWTLSLSDDNASLTSSMIIGGVSRHLLVTFSRIGEAPTVDIDMPGHGSNFSCDFSDGGRDNAPIIGLPTSHVPSSPPRACPFLRQLRRPSKQQAYDQGSLEYDHCYWLSAAAEAKLEWTLDNSSSTTNPLLHLSFSASTSSASDYVALGFRPMSRASTTRPFRWLDSQGTGRHQEFGMEGADILLASAESGVGNYYAADFVGSPVSSSALNFTNSSIVFDGNRTTLRFTRPVISGTLHAKGLPDDVASILSPFSDLLWAVGEMTSTVVDADAGSHQEANSVTWVPGYHDGLRGVRPVDWLDPEIAMSPWRCSGSDAER